ncbi:succinyl-CoA:glutarate CoA-transferase-like isoform X2 [Babylonia areolata]|uniref:succinyl-CoA:glutarate CoA-transferase-like isoform X2 n=1 Tax=Babylonia areolata TaxID=304850 RepID=UPI003FD642B2
MFGFQRNWLTHWKYRSELCKTLWWRNHDQNAARSVSSSTPPTQSSEHSKGPLHGVRVLDLSRVLAGPYCTMILGDLGAEIIKVERPGCGDDTRMWGPPFCNSESAYFLSVNRNKKSITVNLKHPKGAAIIQQLASVSDVVVENYLPGKLAAMGLGYPHLSSVNPGLVYCSITGYGQMGPYAQRAGYDVIVSGVAGLMHITGPRDGEPCKVGVAMTDLSTGLYAHGAIMAALLHRQHTGQGQHIDCNLFATQVASLVNIASNYLNAGQEATRHGTSHPSIVPYQAFKTKDGYILVGAGNDGQFQILCKCIHREEMSSDERYLTNELRVTNRITLLDTLSQIFEQKSTSDWLEQLEGSGIPYAPINNMQSVFSDPQVKSEAMVQEIPHPTVGTVRLPAPAVKFSDTATVSPSAPPTLGQHTQEVLQGILGMEPDHIAALIREKVL